MLDRRKFLAALGSLTAGVATNGSDHASAAVNLLSNEGLPKEAARKDLLQYYSFLWVELHNLSKELGVRHMDTETLL